MTSPCFALVLSYSSLGFLSELYNFLDHLLGKGDLVPPLEMALVQSSGLGPVCNEPCDCAKVIQVPSCVSTGQVVEEVSEGEVRMPFQSSSLWFPPSPLCSISGFLRGGPGEPAGDPQQAAAALPVPHGALCCPDR